MANSTRQLFKANRKTIGKNPNLIKPGQRLRMPDGSSRIVKKGDTLSGIAAGSNRRGAPKPGKAARTVDPKGKGSPVGKITKLAPISKRITPGNPGTSPGKLRPLPPTGRPGPGRMQPMPIVGRAKPIGGIGTKPPSGGFRPLPVEGRAKPIGRAVPGGSNRVLPVGMKRISPPASK
jgi:hypothetical protein